MYYSTEIRWFSQDRDKLFNIYQNLIGDGVKQDDKTDYYLLSNNVNTGIKIREGKHEIKVKTAADENTNIGVINDWVKWSTEEKANILNTIQGIYLNEWLSIKKGRLIKKYDLGSRDGTITNVDPKKRLVHGCGAEFTELTVDKTHEWYTFGFEAFGDFKHSKQNLFKTIRYLELDNVDFSAHECLSYPGFIRKFNI
jgi:hypothetical protein